MKKIIAVIITLCLSLPFYFKSDVFANVTNPIVTLSSSNPSIEVDIEDSRYYIVTQYISLNSEFNTTGLIYFNFADITNYGISSTNDYYLFSFNGADCYDLGGDYDGTYYTYQFRIIWSNASQLLFKYSYKVLKTVYDAHPFIIQFTEYSFLSDNEPDRIGSIVANDTGSEPFYIQQLVLNENLSDLEIESYLEQINQNYLPTMIDLLQQINGQLQVNGEGAYTSYILVKPKQDYLLTGGTYNFITPEYIQASYFGDGFTVISPGYVQVNYDGYIILANNSWFYKYSGNGSNTAVYWSWTQNNVSVNGYMNQDVRDGGFTSGQTQIYEVHDGDIFKFRCAYDGTPRPTYKAESSSALFYYLSKDSDIDYTGILSDQLRYQMLIYDTLQEIKELIPTDIQQENITNINTELNVYNDQVNTITNNFNTQFTDLNDELEFDDLLDVDPESQNNILNGVQFYNNVFNQIIDIPHIKSILIFLLLCIFLVALVG